MPRRNESGPGRRGSARSGGKPSSGRGRPPGKPFKNAGSDKDENRNSSSRKSFGSKKTTPFGSRPERAPGKGKSFDRPFRKTDGDSPRAGTGKTFGQRSKPSSRGADRNESFKKPFKRASGFSEGSSGKKFSKKSRFARPEDKPFRKEGSPDSEAKSVGKRSFDRGANPDKPGSNQERPVKRSSRSGGFQKKDFGNKRFTEGGDARTKGRSDSFGKPYKKVYKVKPVNEQEGSKENETSGIRPKRRRLMDAPSAAPKTDKIRLNKYIANSGISSRREADELITMGLISVNGKIISELGYKVNPGDEVRYESKVLHPEKPVYILMNKPKGFLTTTDDPQERKTVMQIVGSAVKERVYPVGRLDRNTTGLLLLTNDGDLADKLMHPSFNVKKIYKVELDRSLTKADFQAVVDGVRLEEGRAAIDDLAIASDDGKTVGIELHIGWNRVVRRIFESLGYEVIKLDRTAYAGLDKKELSRGQWRFLTREEIIHLKHFK
ncbi:MAG: pseudouridine synthase [Cyclobacteriaceae bacterium]